MVHLCPVGIFRRYQKHGDASSWNRLPRRSRPFLSLLSYRAIFCQRAGRSGFSDLDNSVHVMLPHRRRAVPASALDGRPCPPNADLRRRERGHLSSAPVIAWLSTRGRLGMRLALAWNVLGLLALTNVVLRAVLTAPGPFNLIHAEVPNL